MSQIHCLDLKRQHQAIKAEIFEAFEKVYENTAFSGGPFVEKFEKEFANFCDTEYAIGVNNGTSALHLAMLALGIGPGDEVIVPAPYWVSYPEMVAIVAGRRGLSTPKCRMASNYSPKRWSAR